ncbi:TRAP transporter substrate-binding protein [Larsenimonas salina]|uniref:TRAP transporter substrate-binding protein n=1 Tax=Larsenimonas salina TaxID=1295565 RepID=UPI002073ED20|nr:TRAP transporter substrate-binding protein [Larsenimonas salina]MCM5704860.1 TRAP transporter substrate-binding protein [Larsenimonas salina]
MGLRRSLAVALSASALALTATASQAANTLRLASFWPASSQISTHIIDDWIDTVQKESDGSLKVQLFPSQTLAKADHSYQATVKGIADITITAQGYTAGRFPLTQIVELPGISHSARQGSCVAQTLLDQQDAVAKEYRDSHVLFLFTTGPGFINTKDTLVKTPDDLAGLRIRRPTTVVGDILSSLGAQPVGMPAPDMYTSMQRGVIDGVTLPWEGMKTFHLNELAHKHTEMPLYSLVFVATMSDRAYKRLTPEQRKVIDNNSGMRWAKKAGEVFDTIDSQGRAEAVKAGDQIVTIDNPLEDAQWKGPLNAVIKKYLSELNGKGLPADAIYDAAQQASKSCGAIHS